MKNHPHFFGLQGVYGTKYLTKDPTNETLSWSRGGGGGQGRLKVISSRARCYASQCEHSPDVVAQFLLARVN